MILKFKQYTIKRSSPIPDLIPVRLCPKATPKFFLYFFKPIYLHKKYVYIHTHIHTYTQINTCIQTYYYIHTHRHANTHTLLYIHGNKL